MNTKKYFENLRLDSSDDPLGLVPTDLLEHLPGFLNRREVEVNELIGLLIKRDFEGIRAIAHRLKGHGTGYGFPIVTEIGKELEAVAMLSEELRTRQLIAELSAFTQTLRGLLSLRLKSA